MGHIREDSGDHLLVLAGGKRKVRIDGCSIPKVLAPVMPNGNSALARVLETATKAKFGNPKVVTRGQFNGAFEEVLRARPGVMFDVVPQYSEGTVQALRLAIERDDLFTSAIAVVIAYATMPLVRSETITEMLSAHYSQRDLLTAAVCDLSDGSIPAQTRQQLERRARVVTTEEGRVKRVVLPFEEGFAHLQLALIAPYVVRLAGLRKLRSDRKVGCGPFMTDLVRDVVNSGGNRVGIVHVPAGELLQFKGDPTKVDPKRGYPKDMFEKLGSTPRLARNTRLSVCA